MHLLEWKMASMLKVVHACNSCESTEAFKADKNFAKSWQVARTSRDKLEVQQSVQLKQRGKRYTTLAMQAEARARKGADNFVQHENACGDEAVTFPKLAGA